MWGLFLLLSVGTTAAPTRTPKRRASVDPPSNSALETPAERELRNLFGEVKSVDDEVKEEEREKVDLKKRQHRYKLLKSLEGEVDSVLPHELRKLDQALKDEEATAQPAKQRTAFTNHRERSRGRRAAQKLARRAGRNRRKQGKQMPAKSKKTTDSKFLYEDADACGSHIPASKLGLQPGVAVLLQEEPKAPERPYAKPGVGANQTLKDEGRSKMGEVYDGEKFVEPYVTVYKDGFWPVGCFKDVMFENAEKYGDNKFKYKKEMVNISVAVYDDLVLKEKQKPMTHQVCFEFCRSIKGMGFFGIAGRECYCTPYYEETIDGVSSDDTCSVPCQGDANLICGGVKRFSIFEMHLCGDRGQQLSKKAEVAGESLSAFYSASLFIAELSKDLQASGALLQEVAGLGGDPDSSDFGQAAKEFAGEVEHVMMDGECAEDYNNLLMNYEDAETISFSDMTKAENMGKADEATQNIITGIPKVDKCSKMATEVLLQGYPPFEDVIAAESADDMAAVEEDYGRSVATVHPLIYILKSSDPPHMSSCQGKLLGKPMVSTMAECAQTCEDMVHPEVCAGFQYFHLGGGEDAGGSEDFMQPICFLFKSFKSVTVYECDFFTDMTKKYEESLKEDSKFLQMYEEPKKLKETSCDNVLKVLLYTGMTCEQMFGAQSSIKDTCSKVCKRTKAALLNAVCMAKVSEINSGTPNIEINKKKRCFGGARNKEVTNPEAAELHFLPFDEDGVVLAGDAKVGSVDILEPLIWTGTKEDE
jgi:hypothetical protein